VLSQGQAIDDAMDLVDGLVADGTLNNGNGNALKAKLSAALSSLGNGNVNAAVNQLEALLNQLDAFVSSGKLTAAEAAPLRELVERIIDSLT
jgi:polyhydroxyalkanoate synthesis regulator phasin